MNKSELSVKTQEEKQQCSICGNKFVFGIEAHPLGKWKSFCSHECADLAYGE